MQSLALQFCLAVRTTYKSQWEVDLVSAAPPRLKHLFLCQQFYSTEVNIYSFFSVSEAKHSVHLQILKISKGLTHSNTFFIVITVINQKDKGKEYFPSALIYAL